MGSTVEIRLLDESHLASAMQLTELANWNQTRRDWQRLLELDPQGSFAAWLDGRVIGTLTTASYGAELGWIGMVIVEPEYRRRGIATRLMCRALEYFQQIGITTIKLDATAAGRFVYESLGFTTESLVERWEGVARQSPTKSLPIIEEKVMREVERIDREAYGADRARLLASLITDSCVTPLFVPELSGGQLQGYGLARRGRNAFYVGPVIATDALSALALCDGVLKQLSGKKVYLDLNPQFKMNSQALAERGFVKQRELIRMRYGKELSAGAPNLIFAIAAPEIG